MHCLRDYIGVRGCGAIVPQSDIFINDLPGITYKSLSALSDEDTQTFIGVWNNIQTQAEQLTSRKIRECMNKRFKLLGVQDSVRLPKSVDLTIATPTLAVGALSSGIVLQLDEETLNWYQNTALGNIFIQELWFYNNDDNLIGDTLDFKVIDLDSGDIIWSDTVTLVNKWNRIDINEVFINDFFDRTRRLYACHSLMTNEANPIVPVSIPSPMTRTFADGTRLKIVGGSVDQFDEGILYSDLTIQSDCLGLAGVMGIRCQWDSLVCCNKDEFAQVHLFSLAISTCNAVINNTGFSQYNTINLNQAKAMREDYLKQFEELAQIVCDGVAVDQSDPCLDCNQDIMITESNKFFVR